MSTSNTELANWVDSVAARTKPDNIQWCTGTKAEYQEMIDLMVANGDMDVMNEETFPNCYHHRSSPTDVARVEHLTFVCTDDKEDAGPNNHWMSPADGHAKVDPLFDNCMQGRTLYVIPYCMGPIASPLARCGVEITDSPYVVANMHLMTRMGNEALARIEKGDSFVKGLHSTGDLDPERRFIMHFPDELTIKSIGSGYGGNALLGKKCHALRIASYQAQKEGWLAEHMLILGLESPEGEKHYIAAAFPSACGKTNLAMLIPPESMPGWKIWTVGDDIAWLWPHEDGKLHAINPETGYFGVAPGTSYATNPIAMDSMTENAIFTNVALTDDGDVWWEGIDGEPPAHVIDWKGNDWTPDSDELAAHPNARFTAPAEQCPTIDPDWQNPDGVPVDAVIFGGRRPSTMPLVYQAFNWSHGVYVGATMGSEVTAAAIGLKAGVRRDPMAMLPFCGYNAGDYLAHWFDMRRHIKHLPRFFHVNWFRLDENGKFLWPGFGENMRVLEWIVNRCKGRSLGHETAIGWVPKVGEMDLDGMKDFSEDDFKKVMAINSAEWENELISQAELFLQLHHSIPKALSYQSELLASRIIE